MILPDNDIDMICFSVNLYFSGLMDFSFFNVNWAVYKVNAHKVKYLNILYFNSSQKRKKKR